MGSLHLHPVGRRTGSKGFGYGGGAQKMRYAPRQRAIGNNRIHKRRMFAAWDEKTVCDISGREYRLHLKSLCECGAKGASVIIVASGFDKSRRRKNGKTNKIQG